MVSVLTSGGLLPAILLPSSLLKTSQPLDCIFIKSMDLFPIPYTTSTVSENTVRLKCLHAGNETSSFMKRLGIQHMDI